MIYIASDHAGYKLKEYLKKHFNKNKITYEDLGANSSKPVDYPDYANKLALKVKKTRQKGILICGTGTGMVIAANRHKWIRAALIYDDYTAMMSRKHNDSNIACLRGRKFSKEKAKSLVSIWLRTKFDSKIRHKRRVRKLG